MSEIQRDPQDTVLNAWHVQAIGGERSYVIGAHTWSVREVVDPITLSPVLIFTSVGVGRRVRHYPTNWRDLSSDELHAVSWST